MGFVNDFCKYRAEEAAERDALSEEQIDTLRQDYRTIGEGGQVNDDPLVDYVRIATDMHGNAGFLKRLQKTQVDIFGKKGELALLVLNYREREFLSHTFATGYDWSIIERQKYILGILADDQLHIEYSGDFSAGPYWLLPDMDRLSIELIHHIREEQPTAKLVLPCEKYVATGKSSSVEHVCPGEYQIDDELRQGNVKKVLVGESGIRKYFVDAEQEKLFEELYAMLCPPDTAA